MSQPNWTSIKRFSSLLFKYPFHQEINAIWARPIFKACIVTNYVVVGITKYVRWSFYGRIFNNEGQKFNFHSTAALLKFPRNFVNANHWNLKPNFQTVLALHPKCTFRSQDWQRYWYCTSGLLPTMVRRDLQDNLQAGFRWDKILSRQLAVLPHWTDFNRAPSMGNGTKLTVQRASVTLKRSSGALISVQATSWPQSARRKISTLSRLLCQVRSIKFSNNTEVNIKRLLSFYIL